jgi:hypothetical protein
LQSGRALHGFAPGIGCQGHEKSPARTVPHDFGAAAIRQDDFLSARDWKKAITAKLYKAWSEAKLRKRWLPEKGLVIRKATPEKAMRITWSDGKTSVSVNFYPDFAL